MSICQPWLRGPSAESSDSLDIQQRFPETGLEDLRGIALLLISRITTQLSDSGGWRTSSLYFAALECVSHRHLPCSALIRKSRDEVHS